LPYLRIIQKNRSQSSWLYLITLEQKHQEISQNEAPAIEKELAKSRIKLISYRYRPFGFSAIWFWLKTILGLLFFVFKNKIDFIHCFCTDAAAAGYLVSKLSGKPLIVDSYEPHAEPMLESGTWSKGSMAYKILFAFEKWQSKHAYAVISCVQKMREYALVKYDASIERFYTKPACVDFALFSKNKIKNPDLLELLGLRDKIVMLYAGKFGGSYMREEVFDFIKVAYEFYGDRFRVLLLGNHKDDEIVKDCQRVGVRSSIISHCFVPHIEVADYMGLADFAITPFIPVPSKRYGSPIKNGEYWAMGLPVVIPPNISDDSDIIDKYNIGCIIEELNEASYKKAIQKIDLILSNEVQVERFERIRSVAIKYRSFEIAEKVYAEIYKA
jgi:glycosyltransferase involved in cell wall biosynthesis